MFKSDLRFVEEAVTPNDIYIYQRENKRLMRVENSMHFLYLLNPRFESKSDNGDTFSFCYMDDIISKFSVFSVTSE